MDWPWVFGQWVPPLITWGEQSEGPRWISIALYVELCDMRFILYPFLLIEVHLAKLNILQFFMFRYLGAPWASIGCRLRVQGRHRDDVWALDVRFGLPLGVFLRVQSRSKSVCVS